VIAPQHLGRALVEALDDEALALLAERLEPHTRGASADVDNWLDARAAAAYLGISVDALHKLAAARRLPFEQEGPGRKLYFRRSELDAWRRGGRPGGREDAPTVLPRRRAAAS
jgi:excisionase family DNA binding protein